MQTNVWVKAIIVSGILPTLPSHLRAVSLSEPQIHTVYADYTDFSACVTAAGDIAPSRLHTPATHP